MPLSFAGIIHYSRLKDRLATHFVPFAEFEKDAAAGTLPDFSLIEPNMMSGHGDYHPALGRSLVPATSIIAVDPPSSILGGEAFLERVFNAYRSCHLGVGLQRLEHRPADRVGRTRRNLRPRPPGPGPAARSCRTGRRVRLHVRPFRLSRPRHHGVALGRVGLGLQRGVPPHLADRDAAEELESRRCVHPARRLGAHLRPRVHPRNAARPRHMGHRRSRSPFPKWADGLRRGRQDPQRLGKSRGTGLIEHAQEHGRRHSRPNSTIPTRNSRPS